jgi:hypothetical protein
VLIEYLERALKEMRKIHTRAKQGMIVQDGQLIWTPKSLETQDPDIETFKGTAGGVHSDEDNAMPTANNATWTVDDLQTKNKAKFKMRKSFFGLPQGSPLSPFLSTIMLYALEQQLAHYYPSVKMHFYADDGFFYGDDDNEFVEFLLGIEKLLKPVALTLSREKSHIRKICNIVNFADAPLSDEEFDMLGSHPKRSEAMSGFEMPKSPWMKFLGIELNLLTMHLRSKTRKGNSLRYTHKDIMLFGRDLNSCSLRERILHEFNLHPNFPLTEVLSYLFLINKLKDFSKERLQAFINMNCIGLSSESKHILKKFLKANHRAIGRFAKIKNQSPVPEFIKKCFRNKEELLQRELSDSLNTGIFSGVYGGIIQARMYYGSNVIRGFNTATGAQDFRFQCVQGSVAARVKELNPRTKLFEGSTLAVKPLLKLLDSLRDNPPYRP